MKKKAAHKTTSSGLQNNQFQLNTVALDLLNTTWRIAVPVLIFAGIGIYLDLHTSVRPLFTLGGMIFGFAIAGVLLKKELKSVERGNKK